ncbi:MULTISPECIES: hypothetical protein [Pseudomonas]|uniref:Uncharacterized protein n=1 Tax=Pseudomonas asplenii TaxID=53407 RepID=A0A0N0E311_9PSED|nr:MULTISPECIES: hypothetical protein [Pseudomonas]KPA89511.1 hypothetical protein PF66_03957 [Pseudomonas fuscovaginae]KPA96293.1 hypothetical protein PF70_03663 [Pseudomonas fuscovaginae]
MSNTQTEDVTVQEMTLEQTEEVRGSGLLAELGLLIDVAYESFKGVTEKYSN